MEYIICRIRNMNGYCKRKVFEFIGVVNIYIYEGKIVGV